MNFFSKKYISQYEKIYIFIIVFLISLSAFVGIPTDSTDIGVSSPYLGIGDRFFYINETAKGFGYREYAGNILYPYVLKIISYLAAIFGQDQYSNLWNLFVLIVSSALSIFSLILLRRSALKLFNIKVSNVVSLLFILNPYSYFYSLSGGITNYLIFGISFLLYLFCKAFKKGYKLSESNSFSDIIQVIIGCVYLSLLRPTGGIVGLLILVFFVLKLINRLLIIKKISKKAFLNLLFISSGIILVILNINSVMGYSTHNLIYFVKEGGTFFGFSRDDLRNKLILTNESAFENIKNLSLMTVWKLSDFVSGLSDVRDTHSSQNLDQISPFILRVFTGIFYLFPLNLFCFLGLISNRMLILKSELSILLLSCFVGLSPSLLGVANSRYYLMFYTPFLIFGAHTLYIFFKVVNEEYLK